LRELRSDGKVKSIGAGVNVPGVIAELLDLCDLDTFLVAGLYTLLAQSSVEAELRRCEDAGVGVIIGGIARRVVGARREALPGKRSGRGRRSRGDRAGGAP
jgi:aryl-alcohol dehydrogenase-like predicted oxidoreductase